ncbi:MAG: GTP cyclohydrolase I FolE [Neisseriaceae bacterium]|nr:MAG: GTP cyclohydrolase I FolE [Neisseriaceae bacterium]
MKQYDQHLGIKIHQLLIQQNLENQADFAKVAECQENEYQEAIKTKFAEVLNLLGFATNEAENHNTAKRVIDLYLQERFWGLDYHKFPTFTTMPNEFNYREPLIASNITFQTSCEHHLVAVKGHAVIAYIPKDHLVGLGKLNQILHFFAARPQLQERLTRQVFVVLQELLDTEDVAVVIKAQHDCMNNHGVINDDTWHSSTQFGGVFKDDAELQIRLLNNFMQ